MNNGNQPSLHDRPVHDRPVHDRPVTVGEVLRWLGHGATLGMFLGAGAGFLRRSDEGEFLEVMVLGAIAGAVIFPLIAAGLTALRGKTGAGATIVRWFLGLLVILLTGGAILVLLAILGLKIFFDFFAVIA